MILRYAGWTMMVGATLLIIRILPVVAQIPDGVAFPPNTIEDLIDIAKTVGLAWPVSHALGFMAVLLLIAGYTLHAAHLRARGFKVISTFVFGTATLAFGLFAVALIIDGFWVYNLAVDATVYPQDVRAAHDLAQCVLPLSQLVLPQRVSVRWRSS